MKLFTTTRISLLSPILVAALIFSGGLACEKDKGESSSKGEKSASDGAEDGESADDGDGEAETDSKNDSESSDDDEESGNTSDPDDVNAAAVCQARCKWAKVCLGQEDTVECRDHCLGVIERATAHSKACGHKTTLVIDCWSSLTCKEAEIATPPKCRQASNQQALTCYPEEERFECGDGNTIGAMSLCNGILNCPNGADETKEVGCKFFICQDGSEIPEAFRCNGIPNCLDNSDENEFADCPKPFVLSATPAMAEL